MQKMAPGASGLNALFSAREYLVTLWGGRLGCRVGDLDSRISHLEPVLVL